MAKRQNEKERRARLMNPRTRQGGTAHEVLAAQIAEKRVGLDKEAAEEHFHARAAIMQEQVAQAFENMNAKATRDRQTAAIQFSMENLSKEQRREYHLSDPHELKKEMIPTHEDLNSMGPASCLSLGEDVEDMMKFKKSQQTELRAALNHQKQERRDREDMEHEFDKQCDQELAFANHVRAMCEEATKQEAKEDLLENTRENLAIAEQHRQRKAGQIEKNHLYNEKHYNSIWNSDQLKETHPYLIGSNGRLVRTEYRRNAPEEAQDVHNTNAYLVLEKRNRDAAAKEEHLAAKYTNEVDIQLREAIEGEKKKRVQDKRLAIEEYNRQMAAAKAAQK